jgi:serine/threonine protein kinase
MPLRMPRCPKCQEEYPEGTEYCTHDGTLLESRSEDIGVAETAWGPGDVRDTNPEDEPRSSEPSPREHRDSVSRPSINPEEQLIGQTVGGVYEVKECIGVGGMGVVFKVEHKNLEKEFALKVLGQIAQEHPDAVDRFRQEAIAASHIEHDNIVDIITLDRTDDGSPFIVMELLRGESLADAIQSSAPMPLERALPIIYQICRALHAAHEEGIIHRDLKPENVFLTPKGDAEFVKVLDFGISKIHDAEHDRVRITKTGQMLGTPLYMSPEQAKGESSLDRRVDIYSLGIIVYEMLEGHPPFEGENYFQLIWKHSNEAPPPLEQVISEPLKEAVVRSLGKEPQARFATMLDFEEAIARAVPEIPPPPFLLDFRPSTTTIPDRAMVTQVPPSPAPRRWLWTAAGGGALLLIALLLIWSSQGEGQPPTSQQASIGSPTVEAGPDDAEPAKAPEASPTADGSPSADEADSSTEEPQAEVVTLSITSQPEGAKVFLGDQLIGHTPLDLERRRSEGETELKLVKRGFRIARRRVRLDQDHQLMIPMSKGRPSGVARPPPVGDDGPSIHVKTTL